MKEVRYQGLDRRPVHAIYAIWVGRQEVGVWRKVRPGKHSVLASLKLGAEAREGSTGHHSDRCSWNWLIKWSVLSHGSKAHPRCGKGPNTPSAKLSCWTFLGANTFPSGSFWCHCLLCGPSGWLYAVKSIQHSKKPGNKGAAGDPPCSLCTTFLDRSVLLQP